MPDRSCISGAAASAYLYSFMIFGSLRIVSIEASSLSGFQFVCSYMHFHQPCTPARPLGALIGPGIFVGCHRMSALSSRLSSVHQHVPATGLDKTKYKKIQYKYNTVLYVIIHGPAGGRRSSFALRTSDLARHVYVAMYSCGIRIYRGSLSGYLASRYSVCVPRWVTRIITKTRLST